MGASMNTSRKANDRQLMSEINVTPFVDVMLVLLVIFMVTSPMLVAGVNVDLPETTASPVTGQDEPISVTVDKKGQVYIQDNLIAVGDLVIKLQAITKRNYNSRIFVRGDRDIDYGRVMQVVGAINAAGYTKVALITEITSDKK